MIFDISTPNSTAFTWKNYSFSPQEAPLKSSKKSLENDHFVGQLKEAL